MSARIGAGASNEVLLLEEFNNILQNKVLVTCSNAPCADVEIASGGSVVW